MEKSESTKNIAINLVKFRKNLKQPIKDAKNPFFKSKYVMLEGVVAAIDDALTDVGMTYLQEATSDGNQVSVSTILLDVSGEWMQMKPFIVPVSKNDAQAFGSAETYARRYTLCSIFGVTSDVDDDGNAASKSAPKAWPKKPSNSRQASPNKNASDKQVKMIHTQFSYAAKRTHSTKDVLEHKMLEKLQVSDFSELTSQSASNLIGKLMDKNKAESSKPQVQVRAESDPFAEAAV